MIISASRRTDIPAFFSDWFFKRLEEGYVCVRNPFRPSQISKIPLSAEAVDGFVFWTKNPSPMFGKLPLLNEYPYYFQFTLTAYGQDIEPFLPSKNNVLIPCFQELSSRIGKERILWRYDPIFLNEKYTLSYHIHYFDKLAERLGAYTEKCTVSFLDLYPKIKKAAEKVPLLPPSPSQQAQLLAHFSKTAEKYGISLETCAEEGDFSALGVGHGACIDKERLERLGGWHIPAGKDRYQRPSCGCAESVDIGAYQTCRHGCVYCYAGGGYSPRPCFTDSPCLWGKPSETDTVTEKSFVSGRGFPQDSDTSKYP